MILTIIAFYMIVVYGWQETLLVLLKVPIRRRILPIKPLVHRYSVGDFIFTGVVLVRIRELSTLYAGTVACYCCDLIDPIDLGVIEGAGVFLREEWIPKYNPVPDPSYYKLVMHSTDYKWYWINQFIEKQKGLDIQYIQRQEFMDQILIDEQMDKTMMDGES